MPTSLDQLDEGVRARLAACRAALRDLRRVVVALSGGVDSTLLLALAAEELGRQNVLAVTAVAPFIAASEQRQAADVAGRLGVEHVLVRVNMDDIPNFRRNPSDRCYHCKKMLFGGFADLARARGFSAVASGANVDDKTDYRPGARAEEELGVRRPLLEAGLTKADIRALSRALDLPTWNAPSAACLASRVPYGEEITPEKLGRIERAERVLHELGFAVCRVRDYGALARIEVPPEEIEKLAGVRARVVAPLKQIGYTFVSLDLQGYRTGAMNEVL